MLTVFSTPKPFQGHIDVIQRNAIQSWRMLDPKVEIILFGDEPGTAEVAREYGIRHEPEVRRNEHGTKYLASFFDRAQEAARHDVLCYVNCDIVLLPDFSQALTTVHQLERPFLMVGRRWDLDIAEPLEFKASNWDRRLRELALRQGRQRPSAWIDYFAFRRGLYHRQIPSFVVGRPGWDNWLVWYAHAKRVSVVDVSPVVVAVHQNHDYSYHPAGEKGVWGGDEAQKNYELVGGWGRFHTIENATRILTQSGLEANWCRWRVLGRQALRGVWFNVLQVTRPLRHAVGLRKSGASHESRSLGS
jgi:hypothetical protein